jgi:DNA-binding NtrC family response regulator
VTNAPLKRRLFVVDDDDLIIASLRLALPSNWSLTAASSLDEVLKITPTFNDQRFSAAMVDMHLTANMDQAEGLAVIRKIRAIDPHLEIIAMSGDFDRNLMEQGLKSGASRFLAKPIGTEELALMLEKIEALILLREMALQNFDPSAGGLAAQPHIKREARWIGSSEASNGVTRIIADLRGEPGPILIEGESGTGKEVAAWLLHEQEKTASPRPFIRVNLGAIPETVFESEFFGHVKGAFTGADQNKIGLTEAAHGGDLFLDEIEALPLNSQAKLLRFLESGEIRRVGGRETIRVNARVIVATNRSLSEMVATGEFREDLLWRISGRRLFLPPLRERKEDIEALARHFLDLEKPRRNKTLAEDAIHALAKHHWSGNVRELKRVCEQLSLHAPLPLIRAEDVEACLPRSSGFPTNGEEIDLSIGLTELLARYEAKILREALRISPDIDLAAERIGISRSSMYKKMKDLGIERP